MQLRPSGRPGSSPAAAPNPPCASARELQQEGPKVTGAVTFSGGSSIGAGALEGCLGGDVFNFTVPSVDGTWTGEATVNGDEMNGAETWFTGVSFHGQNRAKSNIRRMLP